MARQDKAEKRNEGTIVVPLNKLILSVRNVRKAPVPDHEIATLADSIASKGLLQNLVVSEGLGGKGIYEVDAGGCRLRALELLAKRGTIARNHPVPVLVIPRDDAREASLAENATKIAMNPADEVVAYREILEQYADAGIVDREAQLANLARRFGRTVLYVEQRLRLAALAPEILDALRTERISLDAAKAYAAYPDAKLQLRVFKAEAKKSLAPHSPKAIRDALAGKIYSLDHPAVVYVGIDAYRAAGGRLGLEYFMGGSEDRQVILDPSIVDRLAEKRAGDDAQALAQEEGWLDGRLKSWALPSFRELKPPEGFRRIYGSGDKLSEDQRAEAIRPFRIADGGETLEPLPYCFVPEGEPAAPPGSAYQAESPEQHAARERAGAIEHHALKLALPAIAGTPLEGRIFWPPRHDQYVEAVEQNADGDYVVALLVRIPAADVDAAAADAERAYEAELAELAEEEAAIADAGPGDEDEDVPAPEPVAELAQ